MKLAKATIILRESSEMVISQMEDWFVVAPASSILLALMLFLAGAKADGPFDVTKYGAVGDGTKDDSAALLEAWNNACDADSGDTTIIIPTGKTFLLKPLKFQGPCASKVSIEIKGELKAPSDPNAWEKKEGLMPWIEFYKVNGLSIDGSGLIDGQGQAWWDISCRYHPGSGCNKVAPTVMSFLECSNVQVSNTHIKNSPQTHILVMEGENIQISGVNLNSPGNSPNTDGIHIHDSRYVSIHRSTIASGDDCISIGSPVSNLNISVIQCGPGHGISIGSLGKDGTSAAVEHISVKYVKFHGTTNGARIKTYQKGKGFVRHVKFLHLNFQNVENPIIIDQYYCEVQGACPETHTGVHIDDVVYGDVTGTSKTKDAISFNCSGNVPCTNIVLDSIDLTYGAMKPSHAFCNNAYGVTIGDVKPISCLSSSLNKFLSFNK